MLTADRKSDRNIEKPGKNDLLKCPRNDGGIPGLKMAVVDSGASAICMKSHNSFMVNTHQEQQLHISSGGIVSGL